jgi:hypothetical protein
MSRERGKEGIWIRGNAQLAEAVVKVVTAGT